jgi:hypothetical protein
MCAAVSAAVLGCALGANAQAQPEEATPAPAAPAQAEQQVPPAPQAAAPPEPQPAPAADAAPGTPQRSGPAIDLAEEHQAAPAPDAPATADSASSLHLGVDASGEQVLSRGLQPERMAQHGTVVGGYGQFNLTSLKIGPDADFETRANVRRLVLFLSHHITDDIQVYTEFEWENALACSTCAGSAEVEQAFVDWKLAGDALALRAGLVIVPMGIINEWHEPPVFNGVDRPMTDQLIIPTTWRELGVGFAGRFAEMYSYQLYLTTTLDPLGLSASGIAGARAQGSLAPAEAFAVTGRFEVEPLLGVIAGASFFLSDTGSNADFYAPSGRKRDLSIPVLGYALDARARRYGFEARALWTQFFLPESDDLMRTARADGSPLFPNVDETGPIPTRVQGGYVELGYDVFHELHLGHQLVPFVRLETYDTQAAVPKGYEKNPFLDVDEMTAGLSYRPIAQLVFKADVQLRDRRLGYDELQLDGGLGYMF